jgi:ABC-2 type transport system permease protein
MRLQRLKAVVIKEALQVWRDPMSLLIALSLPFMQMFLLGYGVSLDVRHLPTCVYDQEASQDSQDLLKRFQASDYFGVIGRFDDYRAVTRALDRGQCRLVVVIPWDFSRRIAQGQSASVQALLDATDTNTANIAVGYAQAVIAAYAAERNATQTPSVTVQSRVWFNEDLESRNFIIPGVVALVMALVGAELTSLTIAREWERGTMELLVSTPVTPIELMIGKLIPYFFIGLIDAAFCLACAVFWFGVPFRGTILTLFFTTSLFLLVVLGIGYLISTAIRSQVGAAQIGLLLTMLPTVLLSGFAFPIDQMPKPIQAVTTLVYARYYMTCLKAEFLKGAPLSDMAEPVLAMALYAAAVMAMAARAFKKRLE